MFKFRSRRKEFFRSSRHGMPTKLIVIWSMVSLVVAAPQDFATEQTRNVSLRVPDGTPLRLYLTRRVSKRAGAPVDAKFLTPLYAFDHEVLPAGTPVLGHVARVWLVSKWQRARAILGGDFSPLRFAEIEFTSLLAPDGTHDRTAHFGIAGSRLPGSTEAAEAAKPAGAERQYRHIGRRQTESP